MTSPAVPSPQRDNLFGVCHAIAQTFGFDPLYLRLALMIGMLVNFPVAAAVYLLAGAVVLVAAGADRMLAPRPLAGASRP